MTGLIVRTDLAPDVTSINDLFDPAVQGQGHDALRAARHGAAGDEGGGHRPRRGDRASDWLAAIDKIKEAVDSGQIRDFTGNDYTDDLPRGDVVAAIGWSGDAVQLQADNPNIEFADARRGLHPLVGRHGDPGRRPEPGRGATRS